MQNIIRTADGYRVTIGAQEWTVPNDPGNRLFQEIEAAIAGGASVVNEAVADQSIKQMSFAQLLTGLVAEGWITEAEGSAWLAGTLPAAVVALIGQLPARFRFAAKAKASRPSVVLLEDQLVQAIAAMQGKTDQLPTFFNTYGVL